MLSTLDDVEDARWLTLTEGEEILWKDNPHPIEYLLPGIASVAIVVVWLVVTSVVPFLPWWTAIVGVSMGGAILLMAHLRRITTIYVITTSEVYKRYGVLDEDYKQIRIDKIQNTSVNLRYYERLLGFGDITIYTSGSGSQDMYVSNIPKPREKNEKISELMESVGESAEDKGEGGMQWVPDEDNNRGFQ